MTTARDRNCAIHPILKHREEQEQHAGSEGDRRDEGGHVLRPGDPGRRDRARGDGRQPRARPVEICRLVPKTAYRIAPAAAAYRPFCSGIPAIPA